MRHCLRGYNITVVSSEYGFAVQQYTTKISTWLHHVSSRILASLPWGIRKKAGLPHHNAGGTAAATYTTPPGNSQQHFNPVHLMSCVHNSRTDPVLRQTDIRNIKNDQALFSLLKTQIAHRRNRLLRILSCRSIQGVLFTKVSLLGRSNIPTRTKMISVSSP